MNGGTPGGEPHGNGSAGPNVASALDALDASPAGHFKLYILGARPTRARPVRSRLRSPNGVPSRRPSPGTAISHQRDLTYSLMLNQVIVATEAPGATTMLANHPGDVWRGPGGCPGGEPGRARRRQAATREHQGEGPLRGAARERSTVALWFALHAEQFKAFVLGSTQKDGAVAPQKPDATVIKDFVRKKLNEFIKGAPK